MSTLSLSQMIEALEKEFEDVEESFLADRPPEEGNTVSDVSVPIQGSNEDSVETEEVERFIRRSCGCSSGPYKQPCSQQLSRSVISASRNDSLQMSKDQLDLAILVQLSATRSHRDCIPSSYRGNPENFRPHTMFLFRSLKICQTSFLFLHAISRHRFLNLCQHFDTQGLVGRIHGNTKRLPPNACSPSQIEDIVKFIDNIAEGHSMPLPGRLPNHRDDKVLLLPTDMTKAKVYQMYMASYSGSGHVPVGKSKFHQVWRETRSYVATMKPASDLCLDCQKFSISLRNSGHLTAEEKERRLTVYSDHLNLAKTERAAYNQQISHCREAYQCAKEESLVDMHYSFDFAQQLHFPSNPLQPGPAYFLTARKCQLFGVSCEALGIQTNYLIDEADTIGKGANTTISLIHHFLETKTPCKSATIFLHADNCIGQNKNNAIMQYLAWRTLTQRHESITISFMISGHTKFAPDRHFGLIKRLYRHTRVETIGCLRDVVINSSHSGANRVQLIRIVEGEQLVHFYDWTSFLQRFFINIPAITSYHVFVFDLRLPGVVQLRKFSTSPTEEFKMIRFSVSSIPSTAFPDEIKPSGLNLERQWYLFVKI